MICFMSIQFISKLLFDNHILNRLPRPNSMKNDQKIKCSNQYSCPMECPTRVVQVNSSSQILRLRTTCILLKVTTPQRKRKISNRMRDSVNIGKNTFLNSKVLLQRGRQIPLVIFRTRKSGWSIRTVNKIPVNTFVMEYIGEVIAFSEAEQRLDTTYQFELAGKELVIDGLRYGNEARFGQLSRSFTEP